MEKILVVLDAHRPLLSSVRFACRLAGLTNSHLTGLFVENLYDKREEEPPSAGAYFTTVPEKAAAAVITTGTDHAITLFTRECAQHSIATEMYLDKGEPIQAVLRESRFADLLVMDPALNFFDTGDEQVPTHFCKEILRGAECPVMLSPETDTEINEVVFCYDGSASAVFAMKQFASLLPEFKCTPVVLLSSPKKDEGEDDRQRMEAWLRSHYQQVSFAFLSGDTPDELFTYLFRNEKKLVVMGSYGRSSLSSFFRRSAADRLIRTLDLPLFITHFNR